MGNQNKNKNSRGQSTIEFLISFTVIFGMTFFIVKTTMNYGNGFYLHWATYAASRKFLTYDSNNKLVDTVINRAKNPAKELFDAYGIKGVTVQFNDNNSAGRNVLLGAYAEFEDGFSPVSNIGGNKKVKYRSESFLGKEPPRGYCHAMVLERIQQGSKGTGAIDKFMTVFDNGC